jgi:hypothetical protein
MYTWEAAHTWRYSVVATKVTLHADNSSRLNQRLLELASTKIFPNMQFTYGKLRVTP